MQGDSPVTSGIRIKHSLEHLVQGGVLGFRVFDAVIKHRQNTAHRLVIVQRTLYEFHVHGEFQKINTEPGIFLVVGRPLVAAVLLRKAQALDFYGTGNGGYRLVGGFSLVARTVPLEIGLHGVRLPYNSVVSCGIEAVRFFIGTGQFYSLLCRLAVNIKLSTHRHASTIVKGEIFCRSFIQSVNLGKTDFRVFTSNHITIGVDTRIDIALFGIVFPRPMEITAGCEKQAYNHYQNEQHGFRRASRSRMTCNEPKNSTHSSA